MTGPSFPGSGTPRQLAAPGRMCAGGGAGGGACGDLSQPLLITGAAGGLNLNPGHQQNNRPCTQPQLSARVEDVQQTHSTLGRSRGFGRRRQGRVPQRPSSLPHLFPARSAEIGNPGDFRSQQNSQRIFSSGLLRPPWGCGAQWECPGYSHKWKELRGHHWTFHLMPENQLRHPTASLMGVIQLSLGPL